MKVFIFPKGDRLAGSSRQRGYLVAEELTKRGIEAYVCNPEDVQKIADPWKRKIRILQFYLQTLRKIQAGDIVFFQRFIYNFPLVVALWCFCLLSQRKYVFDFDDAIYLHYPRTVKLLTKYAAAVSVGSHSLLNWARKYNSSCYLVPTVVQIEKYSGLGKTKEIRKHGELKVGWIGGAIDQYENLRLLVPVFRKLLKEGNRLEFVLIGALGSPKVYRLFRGIRGLKTKFVDKLDWANPQAVPAAIQSFDIGVMPLVDNEWNRGKCSFKAIEYMAVGVATVASKVGENNYLIRDGVDGFLAKDEAEWVEKMQQLLTDFALRDRLAQAGQRRIKANYTYEVVIPQMIKVFKEISGK